MRDYERMFEPLLRDLEIYYPFVTDKMVDWYPSGQMEITVRTEDGKKYAYHGGLHTIRTVYDASDDSEYIDEEKWRKEFSLKFNKKMSLTPLTQEDLSELTGISRNTISKYTNGKATPSAHNLCKIARALGCSVSELSEFR